ncbi:MAG: bifunctional hydroxymethylpyrimidine kinase/phosphomethylpyrimidine kinase [Planctomycetota bacterium]|nr:bifunctional hydroxymethylpyrimidine kinase/phosphomethylpyrimidine kinase [Planctomycetota bacterium]
MNAKPRVLVVAGHDPSGAGLDADRDALAALAVEFVGVETARTDQDDRGVRSIGAREPAQWGAEAEHHVHAGIAALKFGLLPGEAHVARAAQLVAHLRRGRHASTPVVLDPVIAASSGTRFLDTAGVESLRGELLGLDLVVTPNLPEAAELASVPLRDLEQDLAARLDVARLLLGLGARAVVLKGGHGLEDPVRDLVQESGAAPVWLAHPRIPGGKLRGSGCRFASHLAGSLGLGRPLAEAARADGEFVASRIRPGGGR